MSSPASVENCPLKRVPPEYSSVQPPDYAPEPALNEQRVQFRPSSRHPTPTGTFVQAFEDFTIILHHQKSDAWRPCYTPASGIDGNVLFDTVDDSVTQVTIKLQGNVTTDIGLRSTAPLFSEATVLWKKESETSVLPNNLPFRFQFPASTPLPPSFKAELLGLDPLRTSVDYSLSVAVKKTRSKLLPASWTSKAKVSLAIGYCSRTRPQGPTFSGLGFLSRVKQSPDEWFQTSSVIQSHSWVQEVQPIYVNLFIPAIRVFGKSDPIPFHLQLSGSILSLQTLLGIIPDASTSSYNLAIILVRRIGVAVTGSARYHTREVILGRAEVNPIPGTDQGYEGQDNDVINADWEGVVKIDHPEVGIFKTTSNPKSSVSPPQTHGPTFTGEFSAGGITVRDYIALEITGPSRGRRSYADLKEMIPVRFTTESWTDEGEYLPDV